MNYAQKFHIDLSKLNNSFTNMKLHLADQVWSGRGRLLWSTLSFSWLTAGGTSYAFLYKQDPRTKWNISTSVWHLIKCLLLMQVCVSAEFSAAVSICPCDELRIWIFFFSSEGTSQSFKQTFFPPPLNWLNYKSAYILLKTFVPY